MNNFLEISLLSCQLRNHACKISTPTAQPIVVLYLKNTSTDVVSNKSATLINSPQFVNEGPEGGGIRLKENSKQTIVVDTQSQIEGQISFSLIVSVDSPFPSSCHVFNNITQSFQGISLMCHEKIFSIFYGDGSQWLNQKGQLSFQLVPEQFYHIGIVITKAKQLLYINGKVLKEAQAQGAIALSPRELCIGSLNKHDKFFSGCLEDFRIYRGELTSAQMQELASPVIRQQASVQQKNLQLQQSQMYIYQQQQEIQKLKEQQKVVEEQSQKTGELSGVQQLIQKNQESVQKQLELFMNRITDQGQIQQQTQAQIESNLQQINRQLDQQGFVQQKMMVLLTQQQNYFDQKFQTIDNKIGLVESQLKNQMQTFENLNETIANLFGLLIGLQ